MPIPPSRRLPDGLVHYKSTPIFDAGTTPSALQGDHSTKSGVWGQIRLHSGRLRFVVTDPRRIATSLDLTVSGPPAIVEPTILHRVELVGDVTFEIEFWKQA